MSRFVKAERKRVKLKIALTGPSGAGKTFSALALASGIGQKIAVIDTENDSASLYSDRYQFDTLALDPPYTTQKYIDAIKAAQEEKYDVLIIDSISHAWAGDGGLLAKKEAMDSRGGNNFANWGTITKEQEAFKAALLNADIHMICSIRSKQEYAQVGDGGKLKVQKLGLAPIQRDGMEYEFTAVLDIAMDHNASASKDRTGLFDGQLFRIGKNTGEMLIKWLEGAKVELPKPAPQQTAPANNPPAENEFEPISEPQRKRLFAISKKAGLDEGGVKAIIKEFGYESTKDIRWNHYRAIVERVEASKATSFTNDNVTT